MSTLAPAQLQQIAEATTHLRTSAAVLGGFLAALHAPGIEAARTELVRREIPVGSFLANPTPDDLHVIDVEHLTPQAEELIGRWGLSLPILLLIGRDQVGFGAEGGLEPPISDQEALFDSALRRVTKDFGRRYYQNPFFQAGGLVTLDPFTGQRLVSTHSFVFDALHIAYHFVGIETFYVVVGGITGDIRFCCMPRLNCILLMPSPGETEGHNKWSIGLYRHLMIAIMNAGNDHLALLRSARRQTGVAVGFWPNFGHYIWQEIAGIDEILRVHGPDRISHILVGPHSDLPVQEVFPELADHPIDTVTDVSALYAATCRLPYQHQRPIGMLIHADLCDRIVRVSQQQVGPEVRGRIARLAASRFVIWVTLRKNKKVWNRQVDGHIAVLRKLADEVGPLAVVLDGWANTRDAAEAIRVGLEPAIEVIDIIGCDTHHAVAWARASHLYSAVVGSQLYINSYFARRPGVAHGNTCHLDQAIYWASQSPGSCEPTFFTKDDVSDDGDLFANYDFDPELLYQRLLDLARRHYPDWLNGSRPAASETPAAADPHGPALAPAAPVLPHGQYLEMLLQQSRPVRFETIEPAVTIERVPPFAAGRIDPAVAPYGTMMVDPAARRYQARATLLATFADACVLGADGLVVHDGMVLPDTLPHVVAGPQNPVVAAIDAAGVRLQPWVLPSTRRLDERAFCGYAAGWQDGGHWLVGGVPRLVAYEILRQRDPGLRLVMPRSAATSLQAQTLALLGIGNESIIEIGAGEALACHELTITSTFDLWSVAPFARDAALALAARVDDGGADGVTAGARLFIRSAAVDNRVVNDEVIAEILSAVGFITIDFDKLTLAQRITVMRRAQHVVALHGPALAAILFCNPGTRVLELFSPAGPQPMYWSIASCGDLGYGYVVGERVISDTHSRPGGDAAYTFWPDSLHAALASMLTIA